MDQPVTFSPSKPDTDALADALADAHVPQSSVPTSELHAQVAETIEAIRPAVQADGGDLILVGVDDETGRVEIELVGACVGCPASTYTLKAGIERILKDRVEGITEVTAVGMDPEFE